MTSSDRVLADIDAGVETAFGFLVSGLCTLVEIPANAVRPALRVLVRAVTRLELAYDRITWGTPPNERPTNSVT